MVIDAPGRTLRRNPMIADEPLFLGKDLLPWLLLAFGAAMVVANIAAMVRPPRIDRDDPLSARREPPPLSRVAPWILLGTLVAVWAAATLLS
jgi:hypothetical protein